MPKEVKLLVKMTCPNVCHNDILTRIDPVNKITEFNMTAQTAMSLNFELFDENGVSIRRRVIHVSRDDIRLV